MRLFFILIAALTLTSSVACNRQAATAELAVFNGLTMGTTYNVKLKLPATALDRESIGKGVEETFNGVDRMMSTYLEDSELARINGTDNTEKIPLSDELATVMQLALAIGEFTDGAFDITVGPLVNLWGFGPVASTLSIPDPGEISRTLAQTGYRKLVLELKPNSLKKLQPDLYLDLSGIAKGYGVDEVAGYLDTLSITDYMVEAGGEIKARGVNAEGLPWRIGIEKPVTDQRQVQRIIQLDNLGMATSGDYRNYFEIDGQRYSHIIDPVTGWPVAHNLISVTVLDRSTARADALATALMVMGPEAGFDFAGNHGITAMFIISTADGITEKYTGSFQSLLIDE